MMKFLAPLALVIGVLLFQSQAELFYHGGPGWVGFLANCSSTATGGTVTQCPSNVRFRDFSQLGAASVLIPSGTASYNAGGADTAYTNSANVISGTYYELDTSNDNTGSPSCPGQSTGWNNIVLYKGSALSWAAYSGNPVHTGTAATWEQCYLLHPTAWPCQIATWCAAYSAANSSGSEAIGLLTSPDFQTWTAYGSNPVIGTSDGVALPSHLVCGGLQYLYVADRVAKNQIKYYTSPLTGTGADTTWTLGGVALPSSTYDWENANLTAHGIEDLYAINNSRSYQEMVYTADQTGFTQKLGYAVANDCHSFQKYQAGPILNLGSSTTPYPGNGMLYQNGTTFFLGYNKAFGSSPYFEGLVQTMADH